MAVAQNLNVKLFASCLKHGQGSAQVQLRPTFPQLESWDGHVPKSSLTELQRLMTTTQPLLGIRLPISKVSMLVRHSRHVWGRPRWAVLAQVAHFGDMDFPLRMWRARTWIVSTRPCARQLQDQVGPTAILVAASAETPAASDLGFGGRSLRGYSEAEHVPRTGRNQPKLPDHETRGGPYLIRHPGPRRIRGWP